MERSRVLLAIIAGVGVGIASPALAEYISFRSPTGNISCEIVSDDLGGYARCDLRELTMSFPQAPADCDADWGAYFAVREGGGKGRPICVGDAVYNGNAIVLGYGQSISLGGVTCISERSGMTCTNRQGHGFTVARASQRVY
ncbi:DUF6636 domain-containing protein [Pseudogemmobacter sonorensis]|uniref:DUF6636 domain-containing protein n=1 Tax=Pseudogemmobacter sonorensis TaxID=2989681 RepID=UPI0036C47555